MPIAEDLILRPPPDEEDIAARQADLAGLKEYLAEKEVLQGEIRRDLVGFRQEYYQRMGSRYVELDELHAHIAQKKADRSPGEEWLSCRARQQRQKAQSSARDYQAWKEAPPIRETSNPPPAEAKRLFRSIAASIHPDLADDESTREVRTRLMAELNEAYSLGDIARMKDILRRWESSPESVAGNGPVPDLARLERSIVRVREKISRVERETARMTAAPLYRLMLQVREAKSRGRDLLGELAAELDRKILLARQELAEL